MNFRLWNFPKSTLFLVLFAATSFVPASANAAAIRWSNRTVSGNAIKMTLTATHSGSRFTNVTFKNFTGDRAVITINGANNVIFKNCRFINYRALTNADLLAFNGIKGRSIKFDGCTFDRIAGDCIHLGHNVPINNCRGWEIKNCIFKRPFVGGVSGTQASENAIDIKAVNGILIQNCTVSGYRKASRDGKVHKGASGANGGGIVAHFGATNVKIRRCKISNCVTGITLARTNGITNGVHLWNNILSDNLEFGLVLSGGRNIRMYYNTFVNNRRRNLGINSHSVQQYFSANNLFSGSGGSSTAYGGWSNKYYSIAAAKFRGSRDYHIKSNSPARNNARSNIHMTYDVDGHIRSGHKRDLGADEYR